MLVYNRDAPRGRLPVQHRLPDHLRHPGHDPGHRVRRPAARDPRGRPGAHRDRRRAGAGRPQPRRQPAGRRSGGSPCPASSGPSCTASCSPWPAPSGEFGAVKVVSGNIALRTQTATLVVEETYQNFEQGTAPTRSPSSSPSSAVALHHRRLHPAPQGEAGMSIEISGVNKNFGDFVALYDINLTHPHRPAHRAARPVRRRQVDPAADHRRARDGRLRHRRRSRASTRPGCRPASGTSASCSSTTRCSST